MVVEEYSPDEWEKFAHNAHLICFGEERKDLDRIDFALLVVLDGVPQAYMTCKEIDSETVYMQYGGSFPSAKDTFKSYKSYLACLDFLKDRYLRATTLIENTNTPMLKFAMKAGLLISGVRYFKGSILLENYIEFQEEIYVADDRNGSY